jgi:hypothetical protein
MAVQSTMTEPGSSAFDLVQFGDFTLDLRAGELWSDGRDKVLLPDQPFRSTNAGGPSGRAGDP